MIRTVGEIARACGGRLVNCSLDKNVSIFVNSDKEIVEKCVYIAVSGDKYDGVNFAANAISRGAAAVLCEKPIENLPCIVTDNVRKALCKIALFYRKKELAHVVSVTGSYGKTTVKELCASVLSQKYSVLKTEGNKNNLLGLPLTLLSNIESTHAVVELGISENGEMEQLSTIAEPDAVIITGIGLMHSETLGTREKIAEQKIKILTCANRNAPLIIPESEPLLNNIEWENIITVGIESDTADYSAYNLCFSEIGTTFDIKKRGKAYFESVFVPIIGSHGAFDCLLAVALAELYGLNEIEIKKALRGYKPTGNRQNIFEKSGITVMADCYNFGPESARASLEAFDILAKRKGAGKTVLFLGSMLELGEISESEHFALGKRVASYNFDVLVTLGEYAEGIAEGATAGGMQAVYSYGESDRKGAFCKLGSILRAGDLVLIKGSRKMKMEEFIPFIGE